ncbi:MAG: ABC transporter permease [Caldilineaceae bacterium]|nr:ABC transporter permease [Caldilineaceae bacterium]
MTGYIVRRLLQAIPLLIVISIIVFGMISLAPGGPMSAFEENPNLSPEDLARLEEQLGLDQPVHERYLRWAGRIVVGDWGYSNASRRPVLTEIGERLPNTLQLMATAFVVTLLIAIPIGILSALRQYSIFDHVATFLAFVGQAIPIFWFGLILIIVFNVWLNNPVSPSTGFAFSNFTNCADCAPLLPGGGMAPFGVDNPTFWQRLQHMILPVTMLALFGAGTYTRYMRGQMLEVIHLDYMRTARAKGLSERRVVTRHALKNAMTPIITIIALELPGLFGGALFTETIFSWPGMGRLFYRSAQRVDYPLLMGIVMINAVLIILFNLLADVAYAYMDPRVRFDRR